MVTQPKKFQSYAEIDSQQSLEEQLAQARLIGSSIAISVIEGKIRERNQNERLALAITQATERKSLNTTAPESESLEARLDRLADQETDKLTYSELLAFGGYRQALEHFKNQLRDVVAQELQQEQLKQDLGEVDVMQLSPMQRVQWGRQHGYN